MSLTLWRRQSGTTRAFPPISAGLYSSIADRSTLNADQRAASLVLERASASLPRVARLGRGLQPGESVTRLLWLHRHMLAAECVGLAERAEFWWEQWLAQWRAAPADHPDWSALADHLRQETGTTILGDVAGLRGRLLREVFLDTMLGLINGEAVAHVEEARHWKRLLELLAVAGLPPEEEQDLRSQSAEAQLAEALSAGNCARACELARSIRARFPAVPNQEKLLGQAFRAAIAHERAEKRWGRAAELAGGLADLGDGAAGRQASHDLLREGIADLAQLRRWDEALGLTRQLVKAHPDRSDYAEAATALAVGALREYRADGQTAEAVSCVDRLRSAQPEEPRWPALRDALLREAIAADADEQRWQTAYQNARVLLADHGDEKDYRASAVFLGVQLLEQLNKRANWEAALPLADELVRVFPECGGLRRRREQLQRDGVVRLKESGRLQQALTLAESLAAANRRSYELQDQAVDTRLALAVEEMSQVHRGDTAGAERKARVLERHLDALRAFLRQSPHCVGVYEGLAVLHHLHAVQLANSNRPSQALLAVAHALAYRPDWPDAQDSERQIESLVHQLRTQLRDVLRHYDSLDGYARSMLRQQFSAEAQLLFSEAEAGTQPRDAFRRSPEPKRIARDCRLARARGFWLRLGLAEPAADWDHKAVVLDEATDELMARKPQTLSDLLENWFALVAERQDDLLHDIDPTAIVRFFLKAETAAEDVPTTLDLPREPTVDALLSGAPDAQAAAVLLTAAAVPAPATDRSDAEPSVRVPRVVVPASRQGGEAVPLEFWLFSRRDLGKKAMAVLALLALIVGTSLVLLDRQRRSQRAAAYARFEAAAAALDVEAARLALADFRKATPFTKRDGREATLASWEKEMPEWPDRKRRNEAHARLLRAISSYQPEEATGAARDFLSAAAAQDPRTPFVRDTLAAAVELPSLKVRDEAYAVLVEAVRRKDVTRTRGAAERFLGAPPMARIDPRTDQVKEQFRLAGLRPARERRDAACAELADALKGRPPREADIRAAADRFLAAQVAEDADSRTDWVRQCRLYAERLPQQRERDAAYQRLTEAARKDDERGVLEAAQQFFKAMPEGEADARSEQVEQRLLEAREAPKARKRNASYALLTRALAQEPLDHATAVKAADEFLANLPEKLPEARTAQVRRLRVHAVETPRRLVRNEAYGKIVEAASREDEKGVEAAALRFLDSLPQSGDETEARQSQVENLRAEARQWPNWRARNSAWTLLGQARAKNDWLGVLKASEQFLEAPPGKVGDQRSERVRAWYAEAFTAWVLLQADTSDGEVNKRIEQYGRLAGDDKGVRP